MTLNDAAKYTKRAVAYFVLFLILYVIGENLIKGSNFIYNTAFPTPSDPPNVMFGKIPKLSIQTLPVDLSTVEYRKSLPTLGFPKFPQFIRVYKTESLIISPAKEEDFKQKAEVLEFTAAARKASDSKRIWVNNIAQQQFEAEIYYQTFKLTTDTNYLETNINEGDSIVSAVAVDSAKDFFKEISNIDTGLDLADFTAKGVLIKEGLIKETQLPDREILKFVSIVPKQIGFTTVTPSKTKRNAVDETPEYLPIWSKNPLISNINAYVGKPIGTSNNSSQAKIYLANYLYFKPTETFGYYPIVSVSKAWDDLVANKASLVYIKEDGADFFAPSASVSNIKTIDIDNIQLVYYMDSKYVYYLQPVYVFSGKFKTTDSKSGNVFFYLPAVDEQLLVE